MAYEVDQFPDITKRCMAVRTAMTARSISRLYDNCLRPVGLTATQFTLLVAISVGEFRSMSSLGELLCIDRSTLSRNFKPLFDAGYVERDLSQKGRAIALRLTETGVAKVKEGAPYWETAQTQIEEAFGEAGLSDTKKMLRELRIAAEAS